MNHFSVVELKYREMLLLGLSSFCCFLLTFLRLFYSGELTYLFLCWNLFLAGIPWAISTFMRLTSIFTKGNYIVVFMILIWLLFFPNAPYILTDLIHVKMRGNVPIWYDMFMVLSYIWTGMMYGFLSLFDMEAMFLSNWSIVKKYGLIFLLLFLSGFGIYIGRFLRWNTWDLVLDPIALISDVGELVFQPHVHTLSWGVIILISTFLILVYISLKYISNMNCQY